MLDHRRARAQLAGMQSSRRVQLCYLALLSAVGLLFLPQSLSAQLRLEPGLFLGYYAPRGTQHSDDGPNTPANFGGPAVGAECSLWTGNRLGIRASGSLVVINRTRIINPGGFTPPLSGEVFLSSFLAAVDLSPQRDRAVWLGVGPGFVHHGGDAFAPSNSPTETAAVLGLGTQLPLGNVLSLGLSAAAHVYEYRGIFGDVGGPPRFDSSSGPSPHFARRAQHDVVLGATITWSRH
jgi:hypothetical protein